jgi:hypothetical protein
LESIQLTFLGNGVRFFSIVTVKIFVGWGSPDKERVRPLLARLRSAGLELFDYEHDMGGGDDIHQTIIDAINEARIAMFLFSDETAERNWITKETNWAFKTLKDGDRKLQHIIPIWVSAHPHNKVPHVLEENHFAVSDVSNADEESVTRLVLDLFRKLGRDAPVVVPVALFAMTKKQCAALLGKKETAEALAAICKAAGMKDPPPLAEELRKRYGTTPEDLAPFAEGTPLRTIVERVLQRANEARAAARPPKRPLWLRWVQDELGANDPATVAAARKRWAAGSSFLIVDSVSVYHKDVQQQLMNLPNPKRLERAAILWLPPYTRHTASLENVLQPAAGMVGHLGDAFSDWTDDELPVRAMMFDTTTAAATKRWLRDALLNVDDEAEPLPDKLSNMEQVMSSRVPLKPLLRPNGGQR